MQTIIYVSNIQIKHSLHANNISRKLYTHNFFNNTNGQKNKYIIHKYNIDNLYPKITKIN